MATGHARPFQPRPNNSDACGATGPSSSVRGTCGCSLKNCTKCAEARGLEESTARNARLPRSTHAVQFVAADRHHADVGLCVDRNMACLQVAPDDLHDRPRQTGRLPIADRAMALHAPPQPGNRMAGDGDRRLGRACRGCCPQRFVPRARHPRVICAEARGWYSDFHSFALTPPRGCCRNPLPVLRLW